MGDRLQEGKLDWVSSSYPTNTDFIKKTNLNSVPRKTKITADFNGKGNIVDLILQSRELAYLYIDGVQHMRKEELLVPHNLGSVQGNSKNNDSNDHNRDYKRLQTDEERIRELEQKIVKLKVKVKRAKAGRLQAQLLAAEPSTLSLESLQLASPGQQHPYSGAINDVNFFDHAEALHYHGDEDEVLAHNLQFYTSGVDHTILGEKDYMHTTHD